jgi:hypothetical protein
MSKDGIPANDMMTKSDRLHIMKTRNNPDRPINLKEREVIYASLRAYRDGGSEQRKMIESSVSDILGLFN